MIGGNGNDNKKENELYNAQEVAHGKGDSKKTGKSGAHHVATI